jgi:hypothetical protein
MGAVVVAYYQTFDYSDSTRLGIQQQFFSFARNSDNFLWHCNSVLYIVFMFYLCWFWFGLAVIINTLFNNRMVSCKSSKNFFELLLHAKNVGMLAFRRQSNLTAIAIKKQKITVTRLLPVYIVSSVLLMLLYITSYDKIIALLFTYSLIPIIVMINCLVDYFGYKSHRFCFGSKKLIFSIYVYFHSVLGCSVLSVCVLFMNLEYNAVPVYQVPSLLIGIFFFITLPMLIVNILLLIFSVVIRVVRNTIWQHCKF